MGMGKWLHSSAIKWIPITGGTINGNLALNGTLAFQNGSQLDDIASGKFRLRNAANVGCVFKIQASGSYYVRDETDASYANIYVGVVTANSHVYAASGSRLGWSGGAYLLGAAEYVRLRNSAATGGANLCLEEVPAETSPGANMIHLYAYDNGGTTELRARYSDGTTHTIDTN